MRYKQDHVEDENHNSRDRLGRPGKHPGGSEGFCCPGHGYQFRNNERSWQDGGTCGHYRLVVKKAGWEHSRSFVYLQWLRLDQDQQASKVTESMPIDEFNSGDWRYFHHASFREGKYTRLSEHGGERPGVAEAPWKK